jgi:hypothetical protein
MARKTTTVRKSGGKRTAAKIPTKKAAAKRTGAKTSAAKRSTMKRAAAKRPAAKKTASKAAAGRAQSGTKTAAKPGRGTKGVAPSTKRGVSARSAPKAAKSAKSTKAAKKSAAQPARKAGTRPQASKPRTETSAAKSGSAWQKAAVARAKPSARPKARKSGAAKSGARPAVCGPIYVKFEETAVGRIRRHLNDLRDRAMRAVGVRLPPKQLEALGKEGLTDPRDIDGVAISVDEQVNPDAPGSVALENYSEVPLSPLSYEYLPEQGAEPIAFFENVVAQALSHGEQPTIVLPLDFYLAVKATFPSEKKSNTNVVNESGGGSATVTVNGRRVTIASDDFEKLPVRVPAADLVVEGSAETRTALGQP